MTKNQKKYWDAVERIRKEKGVSFQEARKILSAGPEIKAVVPVPKVEVPEVVVPNFNLGQVEALTKGKIEALIQRNVQLKQDLTDTEAELDSWQKIAEALDSEARS